MERRTLLNLGLTGLLGALVLVAVYRPGLNPAEKTVTLSQVAPASIHTVVIKQPGGVTIELRRDTKDHWQLAAPFAAPGNGYRIKRVLDLLQTEALHHYPATQIDLAQAGLNEPLLQLRLNQTEMSFGKLNPMDQSRYVRVGGQVYLIGDEHFDLLSGPATGFVDNALLAEDARIAEITLPDGKHVGLSAGKWQVTPANPALSADALQELINHWRTERALTVTEYTGTERTEGSIVIRVDDTATPIRFDVLATEPELVLGRPDLRLAYHMTEGSLGKLLHLSPGAGSRSTP